MLGYDQRGIGTMRPSYSRNNISSLATTFLSCIGTSLLAIACLLRSAPALAHVSTEAVVQSAPQIPVSYRYDTALTLKETPDWNTFVLSPSAFVQVAQSDLSLSDVGNPAIAPLKWTGLLVNKDAVVKEGRTYSVVCTAEFISPQVVLTAAHCIQDEETGAWFDTTRMYFLLQYQNNDYSESYRPICASRYNAWRNPGDDRYQWDYAMVLLDRPSSTGYYNFSVDWQGKFKAATIVGYPDALMSGQIVEKVQGTLLPLPSTVKNLPNELSLHHGQIHFTQGSSGGAWVANYSRNEDADHNIIVSLSSFVRDDSPGLTFGPYLTSDFKRLLEYTSNGCPH